MKKLLVIAAVLASGTALATGPSTGINIDGTSTQIAVLKNTSVSNKSNADTFANQNLASNAGNVQVESRAQSLQVVATKNSSFTNEAKGHDAIASQNVSSNLGDVTIAGKSTQITLGDGAHVSNLADGAKSLAIQNIASNNACVTCTGVYERRADKHGR
ncbi:hypothetical protein [Xenophilus azovorans]|uniref:hypothetical protein n=1 Tax=Xenophilus TaxID=151754 RepID=UPI00068CB099|nr:hypothetical protein [Xenophilus azovorans]